MAAERVLADHCLYALCQTIKPTAHVCRLGRQPDPRRLRPIQRPQAWQPYHASVSNTASNARKWLALNPGSTTTLRPALSRTSIPFPCAADGGVISKAGLTATSTKSASPASRNRFFHENICDAGNPRSRQNAATLLPLPTCSDTSPRHLDSASARRSLIPQA